MAEFKQYITQVQEGGNVMISEDVIASIIAQTVTEVEGISGISSKVGSEIADLIGKNWGKGMKIAIGEDNDVAIDCNVTVVYGHSVIDVATAAQKAITSAVESMTGVKVKYVNVNVCGIVRQ